MFINKAKDGRNNLCGKQVATLRREMHISQRELDDRLQLAGLDVDKMPCSASNAASGL